MKAKDLVEKEDSKFVIQLGTFWKGLQQYGASLGFSNAEIDEAEKDYKWMEYAVNRNQQVQTFAEAFTQYKKLMRNGRNVNLAENQLVSSAAPPAPVNGGIEKRFRKRAAKAKSHPNYTKGTGEQLGIVAPEQTFDADNAAPEFKIKLNGGRPVLKFKKKHFHAFDIWKSEGNGFVKLDRVMRSPYTDKSELPETGKAAAWKYQLTGVVNDKPVGKVSNVVTVIVYGEV
jgi:hypothetical protein